MSAPLAVRVDGRQPDVTVGFAAAPFASTSYARLRLIRQLHASGLLSDPRATRAPVSGRSASC